MTGTSSATRTGGDYDVATVAYDSAAGAQLWVATYAGAAGWLDGATALAINRDGTRLYVIGHSAEGNLYGDYLAISYDASSGSQIWLWTYDDPAQGGDWGYAGALAPNDSRLYVTGSSDGPGTSSGDVLTVALDAVTGSPAWLNRYNGPANGNDGGTHIALSPDGQRVFVAGYEAPSVDTSDYALFVYGASNGRRMWRGTYDGTGHDDDSVTALGLSPDASRWYATGYSDGVDSSIDWATVAFTP